MTGAATDQQLVARVQKGDSRAFDMLVLKYQHRIFGLISRYVHDADEVQDVAQEAFIRTWKNAAKWEPKGFSLRSWLYRITYNLCIDELRRRKPVTAVEEEDLPASGDQPDDGLYRDQQQQKVASALNELPERQRTAITLCVYQGMSNRDAAGVMEISIEALESLLSRARRALRNKMTEIQS